MNDPQRFTWHQLLEPSFPPFDLFHSIVRTFFPCVLRLTTSPSLTVPGITGGAWGEIYPEGGSLVRCFQREVAPRQSRATTTLSTIWHKSTRCSTLGEIRPPLSPYCLPSPPFFPSRRVLQVGGEGNRAAIRADLPIINSTRLSTLRQCTVSYFSLPRLILPIILRFLLYVPSFFSCHFSFAISCASSAHSTVHGTRLSAESSMKSSSQQSSLNERKGDLW